MNRIIASHAVDILLELLLPLHEERQLVIYLDCNDRRLLSGERHEGTSFALSIGVPQHRALLNGPVLVEHLPDVVLAQLLVQHPNE